VSGYTGESLAGVKTRQASQQQTRNLPSREDESTNGQHLPNPSSSSLDTCDQVSKNEPTEETNHNVDVIKRALVDALVACGRGAEADKVASCGEDFKVGKCLDCGCSPAFPITCDHRLCPECASRRASLLVSEHSDILRRIHYPKMLTLTFLSVAHMDKAYIRGICLRNGKGYRGRALWISGLSRVRISGMG